MENYLQQENYLKHKGSRSGIAGWIFSTDHKRIGVLYLISIFTFFIVGLGLGITMRLELFSPGEDFLSPDAYNSIFTMHGVIMIFLFIIPGIPASLGNFVLPLQLGAKDVAFPRLNLLSWWFYVIGATIALSTLVLKGGPPDTGWTFYAPYSIRTDTNVTVAVFAAFILGLSSILTGLNFVTTIHRMRAKGMTWFRMPLFSWSLYATGWVQILATPILGITLILLMLERVFGIGFFDPAKGGDPILFEHLFWIYSHPAVYVMILPAMGIISEIFPTFSRKTIFGYKFIAFSSMAIAGLGFLVWGHHMFTSGMSSQSRWLFSLLTFLVAVPSGIKVFNWIGTMYGGSVDVQSPMLMAFSFVILFSIGGLTGLILGALSTNMHIHDTAFIVGHFHYVMLGGTAVALFAGLHYWFPKITGRLVNEALARASAWLFFFAVNLLYFPMFIMGWLGMPRRYNDYLPVYEPWHKMSTVGSWFVALAILLMIYNLIRSAKHGALAGNNPWGGRTLEWTTSSPPPHENFVEAPTVTRGPYEKPKGGA